MSDRMDEFFECVQYDRLPWVSKIPVEAEGFVLDDDSVSDDDDLDDVIREMFNLDD